MRTDGASRGGPEDGLEGGRVERRLGTGARADGDGMDERGRGWLGRHPVLGYTVLRVLLFAGVALVLALVGARGLLLLALAILISGLVSFPLLSGRRDAMSAALTERSGRMRARLDRGAASEDE